MSGVWRVGWSGGVGGGVKLLVEWFMECWIDFFRFLGCFSVDYVVSFWLVGGCFIVEYFLFRWGDLNWVFIIILFVYIEII